MNEHNGIPKKLAAVIVAAIAFISGIGSAACDKNDNPPERDSGIIRRAAETGRTYAQQCRHEYHIANQIYGDGNHGFWDEVAARRQCDN